MSTLRAQTVRAILWQGFGRVGERGIRLVANVILVRILDPKDFGLMGAVAATVAAVEAVAFLATDQAIVHSDRARDRSFLSTAFWLAAARGAVVGALVLAASPFLGTYFERPESVALFAAVAPLPLLAGLGSPRAQVLVKDLRFAPWTVYRFLGTLAGLGATVALAVHLRSAWALVLGQLATTACVSAGSYVVAPFLPERRWDRAAAAELKAFAMRAAGTPALLAVIMQAPAFVIGKIGGMEALGVFSLNHNLANVPVEISLGAIGTVAMPAYSAIRADPPRLARAWLQAMRLVGLLTLPGAAACAWVGEDLPRLIYGEDYVGQPGLMAVLSVGGALSSLVAVTGPLFWGVGLPSHDRTTQLVRAVVLCAAGVWLTSWKGALGMSAAIAVALAVALVVAVGLALGVLGLKPRAPAAALVPGLVATGVALGALLLVGSVHSAGPVVRIVEAAAATGAGVAVGHFALRRKEAANP